MSGQYVRLPDSKRNELIAKFHDGVIDPDYEVIPSKNTQGKQTEKKRLKLKEKSKRMSEFLSKVLDEAEQQPIEEPAEEQHEEEVPDDTVEPVSEDEEVHEEVVPAARQLTNQYEEKLNQLAGDGGQSYSRRDRLHFERFNI